MPYPRQRPKCIRDRTHNLNIRSQKEKLNLDINNLFKNFQQ